MRRSATRFADDRGAVAILVALLLIVFIGFSALVVDMGYAYSVKRQLQAAADAAALAGCQELMLGASEADILAVARAYAEEHNAVPPGDNLVMVGKSPDTEVTPSYVKVTVEKPMSLFFGRIFTSESRMIRAQAKAQIAYLTGLKGVMPWAVPVLHADRVVATVDGIATELTLDPGTGTWTGTLPLPPGASGSGYPVRITAYNGQSAYPDGTTDPAYHPHGVAETIDPAATVVVLPADAPIRDVSLSRYYAVSGLHASTVLSVESDTQPTARFDGKNYKLSEVSPGVWQVSLPVPSPDSLLTQLPVDVEVAKGSDKFEVTSAAVVVVRRSTYPIQDVTLSRYVSEAGVPGSFSVSVNLNDFVYGNEYELKVVGGGAEVGNFAALDLETIKHTPNWLHPQHESEYDVTKVDGYDPPSYYFYIANHFPFVIHLGDTIWTESGGLSGPQTAKALQDRFDGDSLTFSQWEALGKPGTTKRLVYVPVVEKVQDTGGTTPMRVVSFAAFFIEPGSEAKGESIRGRFVEYAAPSDDLSETPPDGLYMMTARLVSDGIY